MIAAWCADQLLGKHTDSDGWGAAREDILEAVERFKKEFGGR